ncbi:MAG: hypothetical protein DME24_05415 [Verrucomicrobia bacterium]|nr:MAG: hypothetical protein DME24_05415 [Verrucomicrobiota bacterium]
MSYGCTEETESIDHHFSAQEIIWPFGTRKRTLIRLAQLLPPKSGVPPPDLVGVAAKWIEKLYPLQ